MATEYEKKIISKYLESMPTNADSVTIESVPISVIKAFGDVNSKPLNEPDTSFQIHNTAQENVQ